MAAIYHDQSFNQQLPQSTSHNKPWILVEEIEGLIRVYNDGRVERPPIVPNVPCMGSLDAHVASNDVAIDKFTNLWARIYVPKHGQAGNKPLPLLIYFHGGGFCVGSAAWSCYHEFLTTLASKSKCVIMSVNYRLAPENRLPAAYDDGVSTVNWVRRIFSEERDEHKWWSSRSDSSKVYLVGDSAGANIAYNVACRIGPTGHTIAGLVLIQPFFGGESRTQSERVNASGQTSSSSSSALTLAASDTYWRLSLPLGASRDHPWCNPLLTLSNMRVPSVMVCVSELDILKDRTVQFCSALTGTGRSVETVVCRGVGHAFQILNYSALARTRTQELMAHIKAFIGQ